MTDEIHTSAVALVEALTQDPIFMVNAFSGMVEPVIELNGQRFQVAVRKQFDDGTWPEWQEL